jgi:hypothetical protein
MGMTYEIMVVKIGKRRENSPKFQEVISQFGCSIKVRLGLHETGDVCADEGLVILQLCGEKEEMQKLMEALNKMENIKAKLVDLDD